jgi:integrase
VLAGQPVFASQSGTRLDRDNVRNRIIRPAARQAGVPWCGWHTFRHTCASILFAEGRNIVQVQRWLGHHAPSFTLDTYIHLLEDDIGKPLGNSSAPLPRPSQETRGQLRLLVDRG